MCFLTPLRVGALLIIAFAFACTPQPAARPSEVVPTTPARDQCLIPASRTAPNDTVMVALRGSVNPARAPVAESDAERFLFRALYESLIRVDCTGAAAPSLAEAWASEEGGRRWTFVLRGDARFWDGEPVTAHDIVAAWAARDTAGVLVPWDGPVAQAAQVMSERVLSVRLRRASSVPPPAFANPALAVTKTAPGLQWPIGTGRYWITPTTGRAGTGLVMAPAFGDPLPVLRLRAFESRDPRDLLDAGSDVLVTSDPAVLSYTANRPDLEAVPLPWDHVYVLAAPRERGSWNVDADALSRDAVRVDARAPAPPFWWTTGASCSRSAAGGTPGAPPRGSRRVAYRRDDPVARDLAHRIVALANPRATAHGLAADAFAEDLDRAGSAAYVLELPRSVLDACLETARLGSRAAWLTPASIVPLLEVRSHLLIRRTERRRDAPGLTLDWDGTIRFTPR